MTYFTHSAREVLGLCDGDLRQPLDRLRRCPLGSSEFLDATRSVLLSLKPREDVIQWETGRWVARQIEPYPQAQRTEPGVLVTLTDVTHRRALEEALARSEHRFQLVLKHAPLILCHCDTDLRYTWVANPSPLRPGQRLLGRRDDELIDREKAAPLVRFKQQVLETGEPATMLYRQQTGAADRVWNIFAEPLRNVDGDAVGLSIAATDITERLHTERELRKSQERFRLAIEASHAGLWEWDPERDHAVWNQELYDILGLDAKMPANAETFFGRVHPEDLPGVREALDRVFRDNVDYSVECRILRPDGEMRWLRVLGKLYQNDTRPTMYGLAFDITATKRAESTVQENEARFRRMLNDAPMPMLIYAEDGEVLHVNRAWEEMTGYSRKSTKVLDDWTQPAYGKTKDEVNSLLLGFVDSRHSARFESTIKTADGRRATLLFSCADLGKHTDGRRIQGLAAFDISERKKAEDELADLTSTLEHRVKRQTAEAEQRMQQLRALALELTRAEQTERKRIADILHNEMQQLIASAVMRLSRLVNQVRREQDKTIIMEIKEMLREVVDQTRTLSTELHSPVLHHFGLAAGLESLAKTMQAKHGIAVELDLEEDADPHSEELRVFLYESAREFLFNVKKYAQVDTANLTLRTRYDELILRVEDDGVGCDPDEVERKARNNAAFGLFSISERIELLGGVFEFANRPGGGCRAEIRVPLQYVEPVKDTPLPPYHARGATPAPPGSGIDKENVVRILIADDHHIVREGLKNILDDHPGFTVVGEAPDGRVAVELTRRLRPDVVVTDVSMPNMNGVQATKRIKREFPRTCVVGLSVYNDKNTAQAILNAGADAYLPKDSPSEKLIDAINKAMARRPAKA